MAQIAADVGIRKPSIYAHYQGKDELFLAVLDQVLQGEIEFFRQSITTDNGTPLNKRLKSFLTKYMTNYETNMGSKFWLRTIFFPPARLYDAVMERVYRGLDSFEAMLIPVFQSAVDTGDIAYRKPKEAAEAFLCLLDGISVELLYGGKERSAARMQASWRMYWLGLTNNTNTDEGGEPYE